MSKMSALDLIARDLAAGADFSDGIAGALVTHWHNQRSSLQQRRSAQCFSA